MSLTDTLTAGYHHAMHGGADPAPQAATRINEAQARAELARLTTGRAKIIQRDHVSRIKVGYLQKVLDMRVAYRAEVEARLVAEKEKPKS